MKNAKINKDRPEPNSKEVNDTKDFDFIIRNKKGRQYKILKIAGILGIVIVSFFASKTLLKPKLEKLEKTETITNQSSTQNKIKPPIKNITIPFETFTINPNIKQTVKASDGTNIVIPKNAFIDSNSLLHNKNVFLKYRKYETLPEIFLSGIPMTYDSAGTEYHFESAGMFEIKAFDVDGNLLTTNPGARIIVEMTSKNPDPKFNQYFLNQERNWVFSNGVLASTGNTLNIFNESIPFEQKRLKNKQRIKRAKQKMDSIINAKIPRVPSTANKDRYALNLKFDSTEFPELAPFKNVLFEVNPNNPEFDLQEIKDNWKDIALTKNKDQYLLTLYKNGVKRTIKIAPVISESDIERANKTYAKLLSDLKIKENELFLKETTLIDSLNKENKSIEDSIRSINLEAESIAYEMSEEQKNENLVYRIFIVEKFGIYNSDCPSNLPNGENIDIPLFVNKKNIDDTLLFNTLYLAEYGSNTIYTLYKNSFEHEISFSPKRETIIWGITNKNKIAVYNFKNYKSNNTLQMELNTISDVTNLDSIRNILQWK